MFNALLRETYDSHKYNTFELNINNYPDIYGMMWQCSELKYKSERDCWTII